MYIYVHVSTVNLLKVSDAALNLLFPFSWDSPSLYRLKSKGLNPEFQYSLVDVFFFPMCAALFLGDVI